MIHPAGTCARHIDGTGGRLYRHGGRVAEFTAAELFFGAAPFAAVHFEDADEKRTEASVDYIEIVSGRVETEGRSVFAAGQVVGEVGSGGVELRHFGGAVDLVEVLCGIHRQAVGSRSTRSGEAHLLDTGRPETGDSTAFLQHEQRPRLTDSDPGDAREAAEHTRRAPGHLRSAGGGEVR